MYQFWNESTDYWYIWKCKDPNMAGKYAGKQGEGF